MGTSCDRNADTASRPRIEQAERHRAPAAGRPAVTKAASPWERVVWSSV